MLTTTAAWAQGPAWQLAIPVGDAPNVHVQATAADASGSVYVAGYFEGTARFGSVSIKSAGRNDVFVAKWSAGKFVWAQAAGGTKDDQAQALTLKGDNVYVTGNFDSPTASFGTTSLAPNNGSLDVFVAKLTDAGSSASFAWALRAGGKFIERAVAIDAQGANVYVTGNFLSRNADFGTTRLSSAGEGDVFIAKLTDLGSTGQFVWAYGAGGPLFDYATTLVARGVNVYVAGAFGSGTAMFGSLPLTNAIPTGSSVLPDVFVAKLTDQGSTARFTWAQRAGGAGSDVATGLAVSGANVYLAGSFDSAPATFGPTAISSTRQHDLFVAKLLDMDADPGFVWALRGGGTREDEATGIVANGSSVYVVGTFTSPDADFGRHLLKHGGNSKSPLGSLFAAKIQDSGTTGAFAWATQMANVQGVSATIQGTRVYLVGAAQASVRMGSFPIEASADQPVSFVAAFTDAETKPATNGRSQPKAKRKRRR